MNRRNSFLAAVLAILAALGFVFIDRPPEAQAAVDTVSWTNPTARVDGTPLTNLAAVEVSWGTTPGGPYNGGSRTVPAPGTSTTFDRPNTPGTRCYVAVAIDAAGLRSAPSNEACKTLVATPRPPSNVTVN